MDVATARAIGLRKLSMDAKLFRKCLDAAKEMDVRPKDLGPMALAIGIMGLAKAGAEREKIEGELTDALALVARAEREWRLEQKRPN